ncbi:si:ch211-255f4.7 [Nephila pilipes]|uniref:Si:ch211-255f4.7 n=1 Tax=Nephila pilipes TaxID=299642 RepID=A0A8X6QE62_NEPPI|nr:si:ch211-255f4.7 [Nephila pilipes]
MDGVDFADRVISYYKICAQTKEWTIRIIMHFIDFAVAASWIEYRRHKAMSSAPKSDYLDNFAFRIKIQKYFFHGSEEGGTSEYEPSKPPTPQKRKLNAKVPLTSNHLRKKQNLHLPEIPLPVSKNRCRMPGFKSNSTRMRCTTCKVFLCLQED